MTNKIKFFCFSDVHSHYSYLKEALDKAGFDPNNKNHWIISCGDELDRGDESKQVIEYLLSLPRKIIIRGNHTDLVTYYLIVLKEVFLYIMIIQMEQ